MGNNFCHGPKNALPPYQTVIFFPGSGPWFQRTSPEEVPGAAYWFLFLVRSGRAVLLPVYKGMYERHAGSILLPHIWRDVIIQSAKDLRRAVDYLETRPDMDAQKLAYFGAAGCFPGNRHRSPRRSISCPGLKCRH